MSDLLLYHHLGLGDHIDCNGMVRYFAELYPDQKIHLPAKSNYYSMIDYMFRDSDQIIVHEIDKNKERDEVRVLYESLQPTTFFVVGHQFYPQNPSPEKNCWEYFYEQFNIDYDVKYDYFFVERDIEEESRVFTKLNPDQEDYIFVHDDKSRGFEIEGEGNIKVIRNDISENIFHFPMILENAKEIHVMESSFKSMVEHFPVNGKLYFHDFRGHPLGRHVKEWEIIQYVS